ncbi:hypothetical protein B0H63DRAFT_522253 [Podospora didyma]|uniref:Uncharacterized protein n=1 Tax=Podospora didyma TaxID=330526 RepID=A0AAE0TZ47_9PEZI|nr:hypothetical protein B0H63DRAFT_522253 [Podospora didyma]
MSGRKRQASSPIELSSDVDLDSSSPGEQRAKRTKRVKQLKTQAFKAEQETNEPALKWATSKNPTLKHLDPPVSSLFAKCRTVTAVPIPKFPQPRALSLPAKPRKAPVLEWVSTPVINKQVPSPDATRSISESTGDGTNSKILKNIWKHLKKLEEMLDKGSQGSNDNISKQLEVLQREITARQQRDEVRASIRHEIIFSALKKISLDVNWMRQEMQVQVEMLAQMQQLGEHNAVGAQNEGKARNKQQRRRRDDKNESDEAATTPSVTGTPRANKKTSPRNKAEIRNAKTKGKRALEQCLKLFTDEMNNAATVDDVKRKGELCTRYAKDLLKTLESGAFAA